MLGLARRAIVLIAIPVVLVALSSCSFIPLFDVQIIDVKVNSSNQFLGVSVTFSARFDNADSYEWDFGDGSTGVGQVVTHFYNTTGIFTVVLRVTNNGSNFVFSKEVNILSSLGSATPGGDLIAYTCFDGSGVEQICVINIDGTGQQQLTFGTDDQNDPSINASGLIAYVCDLGPNFGICVINADGTGASIVTTSTNFLSNTSINDLGQIAYVCNDGSDFEICVINSDGSGFMQLTSNSTSDFSPTVIHNGIVAYQCDDEICVINIDGTGFMTLTSSPFLDVDPEMNSSNQIVYSCFQGAGASTSEVCAINADGSGFQILTSAAGFDGAPTINDFGQVVYACQSDELCRINFDGSGQAGLALTGTANSASLSNSGLVAFRCDDGDEEICIVSLSGAGLLQLTNNTTDDQQPDLQ